MLDGFRRSEMIFFWDSCVVNGTAMATGGHDDEKLFFCSVIGGGDPWRVQFHFGDRGAFMDPAPVRFEELSFFPTPDVMETEP